MLLNILKTNEYKKNLQAVIRSGKDPKKLIELLKIIHDSILNYGNEYYQHVPQKYKLHKLSMNFKGRWECHIQPDWLLIYKLDNDTLILERTGTHSELFKK
jgi:mRNA interferase YafQ